VLILRRVPVQVLEAVWAAVLLLGAMACWTRGPFPGALFLTAMAAYGLGRFALQPARDVQHQIGPLNLSQALAASLVAMSLLILFVLRDSTGQPS
jgi:prolipoprotein diacylglyceryltransferase